VVDVVAAPTTVVAKISTAVAVSEPLHAQPVPVLLDPEPEVELNPESTLPDPEAALVLEPEPAAEVVLGAVSVLLDPEAESVLEPVVLVPEPVLLEPVPEPEVEAAFEAVSVELDPGAESAPEPEVPVPVKVELDAVSPVEAVGEDAVAEDVLDVSVDVVDEEAVLLELEIELVVVELLDESSANAVPLTAATHVASAPGYSQAMAPPSHPFSFASARQPARVEVSMYPFEAASEVPGLPITSLFRENPLASISKSAELGLLEVDEVKRPSHVVYSSAPWL